MNVIEVTDIYKKFRVFYDKGSSLKERILFKNRNRYEDRWVLQGVNFEIKKGEAVGLIGHNGCGKSTILKLLSKIMYPDSGNLKIYGRVSSLIELGAGFHPDMSGRENIYTNAAIFGLNKKEIDERLEKIIEFSELEEFIDNPVRTYSSGMYMRLAFSVAINVDADILLIDEILAVGDANFQSKCFDKLRELKLSGITIVLVTHDTQTIENFCNKAIWINDGKIVKIGNSAGVVDSYLAFMNNKKYDDMIKREIKKENELKLSDTEENIKIESAEKTETEAEAEAKTEPEPEPEPEINQNSESKDKDENKINFSENRFGLKYIEIVKAELKNKDGIKTNVLRAGEKSEIDIYYKVNKPLEEYVFGLGFYTLDGVCIMGTNTQIDRIFVPHKKNTGVIKFEAEKIPLISGKYILQVAVVDHNGTPMDFYRNYCYFDILSSEKNVGIISFEHNWKID